MTIANGNKGMRGRMVRKEYTIQGAHVRESARVQHPGSRILEVELVEGGDKAILVPHRSRLGNLEWRESGGGWGGACTDAKAV